MPPQADETHLEELLEENLELAKENNKLLKEMRRNAIIGLIARVVIWLVVLGVPIFFLSTYLGPILDALSGQANGQEIPVGLFGMPSQEQLNQLIEQYQAGFGE
jgi:hypothetical protein